MKDDEAFAALELARSRFLALADGIRPRLHRFCARMSGSVLDGEDLVQETLAHGFFKLSTLADPARLEPWLLSIAHRKCLDFLRRRRAVEVLDADATTATAIPPDVELETSQRVSGALEALVVELPPKERACVLLKDVLDYSLLEIAEIASTSEGGVKAALHRGRKKLAEQTVPPPARALDPSEKVLLEAYLDRFNRQDWDGVKELIRADARLEVVGVADAPGIPLKTAKYFDNYAALASPWRWRLASVEGEPIAVKFVRDGETWQPHTAARIQWQDGKVVHVRDYVHVDYLLAAVAVS